MTTPRFSSQFGQLCRTSLHAHLTGRHAAAREHWMREARYGPQSLRALHVAYARGSHHSFLHHMRLALGST